MTYPRHVPDQGGCRIRKAAVQWVRHGWSDADVTVGMGLEWRELGCSMCVAMNGDAARPGRTRGVDLEPELRGPAGIRRPHHLMSPAMAAAAAVTGRLTDVEQLDPSRDR